jgi:hypothetical protein
MLRVLLVRESRSLEDGVEVAEPLLLLATCRAGAI